MRVCVCVCEKAIHELSGCLYSPSNEYAGNETAHPPLSRASEPRRRYRKGALLHKKELYIVLFRQTLENIVAVMWITKEGVAFNP